MATLKEAAEAFLACRRIAVTGVSHAPAGHGGNTVFQRLKARGYEVFAVNPNAPKAEGVRTYPSLAAIPGGVEAVVIATRPDHAEATMREAVALGVKRVWMHRAIGPGSVSAAAARFGREHGVAVIEGGCPLMFGAAADPVHRVMCVLLQLAGKVPRRV